MKFIKPSLILINIKTFKRHINNEHLLKAINDLKDLKPLLKQDKIIKQTLDKIELDEILKKESDNESILNYNDIQKNLEESKKMMDLVREKLNMNKEKSIEITIKVDEQSKIIDKNKIENLNEKSKYIRNNENSIKINKEDIINTENAMNIANNTNIKLKSNNWLDFEWLNTIIDFMKGHSSLILTISSGLIIGGMWYVNSRGIDIGALIGRLGLSIYSNLTGSGVTHSNISNTNIELPSSANTTRNHQTAVTAHGFFRQLGAKILEMLDIYIEKMKDKRQKYN